MSTRSGGDLWRFLPSASSLSAPPPGIYQTYVLPTLLSLHHLTSYDSRLGITYHGPSPPDGCSFSWRGSLDRTGDQGVSGSPRVNIFNTYASHTNSPYYTSTPLPRSHNATTLDPNSLRPNSITDHIRSLHVHATVLSRYGPDSSRIVSLLRGTGRPLPPTTRSMRAPRSVHRTVYLDAETIAERAMIDLLKTTKILSRLYQEGVVDMFDMVGGKGSGTTQGAATAGSKQGEKGSKGDSEQQPSQPTATAGQPTSGPSSSHTTLGGASKPTTATTTTATQQPSNQPVFLWCLTKSHPSPLLPSLPPNALQPHTIPTRKGRITHPKTSTTSAPSSPADPSSQIDSCYFPPSRSDPLAGKLHDDATAAIVNLMLRRECMYYENADVVERMRQGGGGGGGTAATGTNGGEKGGKMKGRKNAGGVAAAQATTQERLFKNAVDKINAAIYDLIEMRFGLEI